MELLLFLYSECRFHLSEELLEGEVLRPGQVEHLHTAHNITFNFIKTLNSIIFNLTFRCLQSTGYVCLPGLDHIPVIRLLSNLRSTTREYVYLARRDHFRSRDKDGGHTIRSAS